MAIVLKRNTALNDEVEIFENKSRSVIENRDNARNEYNKKIFGWFLRLDWIYKALLILILFC
jgi:hypothetical protein